MWFTLVACTLLLLLFLVVFSFMRLRYKAFYMPKCYRNESWAPRGSDSWFDWLYYTISYPDSKLLASSGIDALLYIKFLKFCLLLLVSLSFLSCTILLPINYFAKTNEDQATSLSTFDSLSIASLPQGSKIYWVHLLSVFCFSTLTYYCIYRLQVTSNEIELANSQYLFDSIQNNSNCYRNPS